jgi:hypothetical protein
VAVLRGSIERGKKIRIQIPGCLEHFKVAQRNESATPDATKHGAEVMEGKESGEFCVLNNYLIPLF